jgi:hypothetical protein
MRTFRILPGERSELFSPVGLRLLDGMTGAGPIGRVDAFLDVRDGTAWRATGIQAVRTPSGVVAYPGLERRADVSGPPRHYRVRITADFYRPFYPLATLGGFEFDAFPWNDAHPPRSTAQASQDVRLAPSPGYPFPAFVPVLRGRVLDVAGKPVADAEVSFDPERVLSDDRGELALPLRFAAPGVTLRIEAVHNPTGRTGSLDVTLPGALGKSQTISIS